MGKNLPDGGAKLVAQRQQIMERMAQLKRPVPAVDLTAPQAAGNTNQKVCIHYSTYTVHLNFEKHVLLIVVSNSLVSLYITSSFGRCSYSGRDFVLVLCV